MNRLLTGCTLACAAILASTGPASAQQDEGALRERALRLMSETPLIDGHNDLPWQFRGRVDNQIAELDISQDLSGMERPTHTDIPRLRAGRVGAQFWSVYIPIGLGGGTPGDVRTVVEQIDLVHRLAARYPADLEIALTPDDVERIFKSGKIASMIGMEGGHSIGNSLGALRATYALGARYMTITHSKNTLWADSATDDPMNDGLSPFGKEVIREMNRLGMLVDLSHVSEATMHDALDVSEAPVIFSHSSCKALTDHPRNVPDDVLERVRDTRGVVMVTFVPSYINEDVAAYGELYDAERARYLEANPGDIEGARRAAGEWAEANPGPKATLADVADHIDHVRAVAGASCVGIGSDYDGIRSLPVGLEDVSTFPDLIVEMLRRGWSDDEIRGLLGENVLRVWREAESVAARLQQERPASDAIMEELDGATTGRGSGEASD